MFEGLGERRKLPKWGPGRSPSRKWVLVHCELEKTHLVITNLFLLTFLFGCSMSFKVIQSHARQKKWSGHGRTGRTADYGLATQWI